MAKASSRRRKVNEGDPTPWIAANPLRLGPTPKGRVITCCWPIGEPGTPEFRFCDIPSGPGQPYCAEHLSVTVGSSATATDEPSGGGAPAPARRTPTNQGAGAGRLATDDPMAGRLQEGFAAAVRQAVQGAHAAGLAVPARVDGVAVEVRPDGQVVPIDNDAPWSPTDWRKSAKR